MVLPMLRLDPLPRTQSAPDLAAPPAALPESVADALPDPHVPRLDLLRTDADGQMIVTGRTGPNLTVALVLDGLTLAETRSDGTGHFVAFLTLDRSDAARVLWLVVHDERGDVLASDDTVILAPDTPSHVDAGAVDLAALAAAPYVSRAETPVTAPPAMPRPSTVSGERAEDVPLPAAGLVQFTQLDGMVVAPESDEPVIAAGVPDPTTLPAGTTSDPAPRATVPV